MLGPYKMRTHKHPAAPTGVRADYFPWAQRMFQFSYLNPFSLTFKAPGITEDSISDADYKLGIVTMPMFKLAYF